MKNICKRVVSLLICLTLLLNYAPGAAVAADDIIYVQPNSNWLTANAWFAAYFWSNDASTWGACSDADGDGIYSVVVPDGYTKLIFCRMNPASTEMNWDKVWNQSADLTVPTDDKVVYVVEGWDGAGQWVEFSGATNDVASGTCGDNLTWALTSDGTLTISGTGRMHNYEAADGEFAPWYKYEDSIQKVIISDGITTIGDEVFRCCDNLTEVAIPDGITQIGNGAFDRCASLTTVAIPDSVTGIGYLAFNKCTNLTEVAIPDSVTEIGYGAFWDCASLTRIAIPDSVISIYDNIFIGCTNLTGIWVDDGNQYYSSDAAGVMFNKEKTTLIAAPGTITTYDIPLGVSSIGESAFRDCTNLATVTIPDSVTAIDVYAFMGCTSLNEVVIPESVTSIKLEAFDGCESLTQITVPSGIRNIYFATFRGCTSLTGITIPSSVTSIDERAFAYCYNLTDVYYYGTQSDWDAIVIGSGNEYLTNATLHLCEYDVKFQTKTENGVSAIRLLTYVGDLNAYANVTFNVTIDGKTTPLTCNKAYSTVIAGEKTVSAPEIFDEGAEYFCMYTITGIKEEHYAKDMIISVTWTRTDGSTNTSYSRIVNIGEMLS